MSEIDPTKFEPQGKPTIEQVRYVWNSMPNASARNVAELMIHRGFLISYRTVARMKAADWKEPPPRSKPPGKRSLLRDVKAETMKELKNVPPATLAEAGQIAAAGGLEEAVSGGKLTDDDYARIEKRIQALSPETKEKLLAEQEKARIIMNIVMMEEATRRAHVMVLIPKDTGSFVADVNDAAGTLAPVAPIENPADHDEMHRNGDGAKVIEGRVNLPSALSLKLRQLREETAA